MGHLLASPNMDIVTAQQNQTHALALLLLFYYFFPHILVSLLHIHIATLNKTFKNKLEKPPTKTKSS